MSEMNFGFSKTECDRMTLKAVSGFLEDTGVDCVMDNADLKTNAIDLTSGVDHDPAADRAAGELVLGMAQGRGVGIEEAQRFVLKALVEFDK